MINPDNYQNNAPYEHPRKNPTIHAAWGAAENEMLERFKTDALEDVGLTGHPKADKAYNLAWEQGHASGLHDVYCHLQSLAELLL